MNAHAAALQPDLFAEPAPAGLEREATTTTDAAPVLYHCHACERRTRRPQLWRRTLTRTTTRAAYHHPAFEQQIALADVVWSSPSGHAHRGPEPPADRCPSCKLPAPGRAIHGTVNHARACDARCMYAKGPDCECSCGGANHGIGYHRT